MPITTELRGPCPKEIVDVIDAVAHAKRIDRTQMVNRILGEWAKEKMYECSCITRVTRGNPPLGIDAEEAGK